MVWIRRLFHRHHFHRVVKNELLYENDYETVYRALPTGEWVCRCGAKTDWIHLPRRQH